MTHLMRSIDAWFASNPPPDGWTTAETAKVLASCIVALRPTVCIELGVFGGRSCIPVAMALREVGRGTIICVDPWSAQASVQGMPKAHADWWGRQEMHDQVYARFMKAVRDLGLLEVIKVKRAKSDDIPVPENIGYLAIDANHGAQAERDFARFTPSVKIGGLLWADDLDWDGGHVQKAADRIMSGGFDLLYRIGEHGAIFQRVL